MNMAKTEPAEELSFLEPRVWIPFMVTSLIWGSTWLVIRDQLGTVPTTWSVTYRFIVAAIGNVARKNQHIWPVGAVKQARQRCAEAGKIELFGLFIRGEADVNVGHLCDQHRAARG